MIFKLLKCALSGEVLDDLSCIDREAWGEIYKVSKKHDLAHMVGYALSLSSAEVDEDVKKAFEKSSSMAAFRYVKKSFELDAIKGALNKAKIDFLPLKGSVINEYYKEPWLRTSCDIDVLVKKEDLEKAQRAIVDTLGYELQPSSTRHDVSLMSPSGVHLELHFELNEELFKESKDLTNIWQGKEIVKVSEHEYQMTNEMFLFYHIYHMAKHFENGGCGIKPLLDLWIIKNKMGYDEQKARALIEKEGYTVFYESAIALMNVWLEGSEHTSITKNMESYILDGGVYGSIEHNLAVSQAKKGSAFKILWCKIFTPYSSLKVRYPVIGKFPPLYPLFWVVRWFRLLFTKDRERAMTVMKTNQKITQDEREAVAQLLKSLGL